MKLRLSNNPQFQLSEKKVSKNWYKATPFLVVLVLFALSATAGLTWIIFGTMTMNVDKSLSYTENMPSSLIANAGDYYDYTLSVKNEANQQHKYDVEYWVSSNTTLVDNDVKIRLMNATGTILNETMVLSGTEFKVSLSDIVFEADETKVYNLSVELSPSAQNGTYLLNWQWNAGANSFK